MCQDYLVSPNGVYGGYDVLLITGLFQARPIGTFQSRDLADLFIRLMEKSQVDVPVLLEATTLRHRFCQSDLLGLTPTTVAKYRALYHAAAKLRDYLTGGFREGLVTDTETCHRGIIKALNELEEVQNGKGDTERGST